MGQVLFALSGAPSTTSHLDVNLSILDYYILSIFHYLVSPLSYHTLIFDLRRTNHPRTSVTAFNGQASSDELPTNDSHRTTGKTIIVYYEDFKPSLMEIETPIYQVVMVCYINKTGKYELVAFK